jgi:hypothetical protein
MIGQAFLLLWQLFFIAVMWAVKRVLAEWPNTLFQRWPKNMTYTHWL